MILHVFLAETKFIILHVLYIVSSRATAYLVLQRSVYQKYPVSLGFFFLFCLVIKRFICFDFGINTDFLAANIPGLKNLPD